MRCGATHRGFKSLPLRPGPATVGAFAIVANWLRTGNVAADNSQRVASRASVPGPEGGRVGRGRERFAPSHGRSPPMPPIPAPLPARARARRLLAGAGILALTFGVLAVGDASAADA